MDCTKEQVAQVVSSSLEEKGFDLIDLHISYGKRNHLIQILTDKPQGGITIEECSLLNREIGNRLEEQGIFHASYTIEVSSPGLDRPLTTEKDFRRNISKEAHFFLKEPLCGQMEHCGIISKVDDEGVLIEREGKRIFLPLSCIQKAKQVIEKEG